MDRRARLAAARLYFVTDRLDEVDAALAGGADIVQFRRGESPAGFREAADRHGALFVVNDDPELALACGADGVHVGQEDMPADEVRAAVGPDVLIGVSTHTPEQFDAGLRSTADYLSVGPVHETPTKPGRRATGYGLVRHAAGAAKPWFAIGGIDSGNIRDVIEAGAQRVVVVRAIRDARDPERAARELREALASGP